MSRKIQIHWLLPTLLLGLDLGWRMANFSGSPIEAQQPLVQNAQPSAIPGELVAANDISTAYEKFHPVNHVFQTVSRTLAPSVVHIVARKSTGDDGDVEESGSGVIVATGHAGQFIMTNNHVVQNALPRRIRIQLSDGRVISPEFLWTDAKADIAVMKLANDAPQLVPAKLGNSDEVTVGTWVMAMGSPFGLMHSVSQGIISARGRHEAELFQDGVENQDFLQTDAAINPGNSGGPLVNLKGEIIGINTAIASQGGGSEGVGFSIPINLARWIMDQLLTNGKVQRGALGIDLDELSASRAQQMGLEHPHGAIVTSVHPDSPAFHAGLQSQDVIVRFNGTEIQDLNHLINVVSMAPIGKRAEVLIWRNRNRMVVGITVGPRETVLAPMPELQANPTLENLKPEPKINSDRQTIIKTEGPWGLTVRDVLKAEVPKSNGSGPTSGAIVISVEESSPLAGELEVGDVITSLNGRKFTSARSMMDGLNKMITSIQGNQQTKANKSIEIEVVRNKPGSPSQTFILRVDL